MGIKKSRNDSKRGEITDSENEFHFLTKRHSAFSNKFRSYYPNLHGVQYCQGNSVKERGRNEGIGSEIELRPFLFFLSNRRFRNKNDRDRTENGVEGRRDGRSEISVSLQYVKYQEDDGNPECRTCGDRNGRVGFIVCELRGF